MSKIPLQLSSSTGRLPLRFSNSTIIGQLQPLRKLHLNKSPTSDSLKTTMIIQLLQSSRSTNTDSFRSIISTSKGPLQHSRAMTRGPPQPNNTSNKGLLHLSNSTRTLPPQLNSASAFLSSTVAIVILAQTAASDTSLRTTPTQLQTVCALAT